jgi:hypothetical protein
VQIRVAVLATLVLSANVVPTTALAQGASLEATPGGTAPAGSTVTVKWSGPNGPGDYVTVVRKGAEPNAYLDYKPTSSGRTPVNPVVIVLPAEPGAYEIRYLTGNPRRVLAQVPYEVTAVTASIEGPAGVTPDSRFEVTWSGPNNGGDFVTIVATGAAPRAYGSYVDARNGRTDKPGRTVATLRAPAKPGSYELRYVQQGTRVIGTRPIEVSATAAPNTTPPLTVVPIIPVAQGLLTTTQAPPATTPPAAAPAPAQSAPSLSSGSAATTAISSVATATGRAASSSGLTDLNGCTLPLSQAVDLNPPIVTPGGVSFVWQRHRASPAGPWGSPNTSPYGTFLNAVYTVTRQDLGGTPVAVIEANNWGSSVTFPPKVDYIHRTHLEPGKTYRYTITTYLRGVTVTPPNVQVPFDNGCASREVTVTGPTPATLTLRRVTPGSGTVTIAWDTTAQGQSGFLVLGTGLPPEGTAVGGGAREVTIANLSNGNGEWLVSPYWNDPPNRVIDVSTGLKVTSATKAASGKYRISIAGFQAHHETFDNQASLDGRGDEVYAAAIVTRWFKAYPSAGATSPIVIKSDVYGDSNGSTRVPAGHASAQGGLLGGDVVPAGWGPGQAPSASRTAGRFPLTIWEGELSDGNDNLAIHPTLWEFDGNTEAYDVWARNTSGWSASANYFNQDVLKPAMSWRRTQSIIFQWAAPLTVDSADVFSIDIPKHSPEELSAGKDRPIGLDAYLWARDAQNIYDYSRIFWVDQQLSLNHGNIEAFLDGPPAPGLARGMIAMRLTDSDTHSPESRLDGDYTLFLYIERLP